MVALPMWHGSPRPPTCSYAAARPSSTSCSVGASSSGSEKSLALLLSTAPVAPSTTTKSNLGHAEGSQWAGAAGVRRRLGRLQAAAEQGAGVARLMQPLPAPLAGARAGGLTDRWRALSPPSPHLKSSSGSCTWTSHHS
jgi:hypothetical protein